MVILYFMEEMNSVCRKMKSRRDITFIFVPPWTPFTNDYGFNLIKKKNQVLVVIEVIAEVIFTIFINQI